MASLFGPPEIREVLDELRHDLQELRDEVHSARSDLRVVAETVTAIEHEIGGAPKVGLRPTRLSIRDRLHHLEGEAAAARLTQEILTEIRATHARTWSRFEKVGLFAFAVIGALASVLRVLGVGL